MVKQGNRLELDIKRRLGGRGYYLHRDPACISLLADHKKDNEGLSGSSCPKTCSSNCWAGYKKRYWESLMAKMRVFELAKELKLDNQDLVKQLIDLGFDVRNHMSVLSDDQTEKAREQFASQHSEVVEQKRITTRVIRRRRKKVEPEDSAYLSDDSPRRAGRSGRAPGGCAAGRIRC